MLLFKIAVLTKGAVTATDPLIFAVSTVCQAPNRQSVMLLDSLVTRATFFPTSQSQVEM